MRGVSGKEWILLSERIKPSPDTVRLYGEFLAQLIANRGFEGEHEKLFDLKLKYLPPYTLLPNAEEGIGRILEAVKRGERIIIFGDYDVDGITGTAILYEILKEAGARVATVLPSRSTGYGLSRELVSLFSKYGDLLITVDNGTSAVREIDGSGMDVVVIDHHNVPEEVPKRAVLINPRLSEEAGDLREISSSAMCFYIGAVLSKELGLERDVRELLGLVALGTVGDVMPMNRTNRILVYKGMAVLENILSGNLEGAGIRALLKTAGVEGPITSKDLAYSVAPRINAPGRVGDPRLALKLLMEKDEDRALQLARKVEALNLKRRAITDRVYREAYRKALRFGEGSFISLWDREWHVGVLGIVAGRLSSELGRPVAVFSKGENHSVGSVRSVEGVDVYEGLRRLSHMFVKWGGHPQAAGLTLESSLLEEFSERAEEIFSHLPRRLPPLYIDMELSPSSVSEEHLQALKRLEPYGERNPVPTFLSEKLRIESLKIRSGRAEVRLGGVEMVCWDGRIFERLKIGESRRVVFSIVGGEFNLIDAEERDGAG